MSGQATGWVLRCGPRDRAMRAVLICIADAANRDGEHAKPGMQAMVEGSLYSEGHVQRTLTRLAGEGWIDQTELPGPGKVAEFRIPGVAEYNVAHYARRSDPTSEPVSGPTSRKRRANVAQTSFTQMRDVPDERLSLVDTDTDTDTDTRAVEPRAVVAETDARVDEAERLTEYAFTRQVRPTTTRRKVTGLILGELFAGQPPDRIQAAIDAGDVTWTEAGIRTAIGRARPRQQEDDLFLQQSLRERQRDERRGRPPAADLDQGGVAELPRAQQ